jgi:hypothetical protein
LIALVSGAQVRANLQEDLIMELYREDQFGEMLQEEESAVRRRAECVALIAKLERAQTVIDGLRTMPVQPGDIIAWPSTS